MNPHDPPLCGSLPQGGEGSRSLPVPGVDPAWGGPAPDLMSPHAPPLRGSLPQGGEGPRSLPVPGVDPAWGSPAPDRSCAQPPKGFEGSYLGNRDVLTAASRLECKICWWVYDPKEGDPQWQIPAGTPFADLPPHWRCPNCDGDPDQFLLLPSEGV